MYRRRPPTNQRPMYFWREELSGTAGSAYPWESGKALGKAHGKANGKANGKAEVQAGGAKQEADMRQGSAKGDLPDKGKVILRCSGLVRPTMAMATGSLQIKARWSPTCRFSRPESGRVGPGSWRRLASEEQPDPKNNRIQYASSDGPGGTDLEFREQRGGTWALLQILLSSLPVDLSEQSLLARGPLAHGPPLTTPAHSLARRTASDGKSGSKTQSQDGRPGVSVHRAAE